MDWSTIPGFGVAGNFTGHLEQAGESPDFVGVKADSATAPKGVFPFYVPGNGDSDLHVNPYASDVVRLLNDFENHQIEPEISILFEVRYRGDLVSELIPRRAFAHNDCSIRRKGANKISEKKNWGAQSKGVSGHGIEIDHFSQTGILKDFRIASYLIRNGTLHAYGVDSAVSDYSYIYERLVEWLIDRFNNQRDSGPLEDLQEWLRVAGQPERILVSVGATRYVPFGETTFLKPGDESIVVLYNGRHHTLSEIESKLLERREGASDDLMVLRQLVVAPE